MWKICSVNTAPLIEYWISDCFACLICSAIWSERLLHSYLKSSSPICPSMGRFKQRWSSIDTTSNENWEACHLKKLSGLTNSVEIIIFSGFGDQSRYLPQCCRRYLGKWYLSSPWPPSNCTALWEGWCLHPCTTGSKCTYALCRWWIFPVFLSSPVKHNAWIVWLLKIVMPLSVCQQSW